MADNKKIMWIIIAIIIIAVLALVVFWYMRSSKTTNPAVPSSNTLRTGSLETTPQRFISENKMSENVLNSQRVGASRSYDADFMLREGNKLQKIKRIIPQ
jgi:flagellar basal body-associated protein FliL